MSVASSQIANASDGLASVRMKRRSCHFDRIQPMQKSIQTRTAIASEAIDIAPDIGFRETRRGCSYRRASYSRGLALTPQLSDLSNAVQGGNTQCPHVSRLPSPMPGSLRRALRESFFLRVRIRVISRLTRASIQLAALSLHRLRDDAIRRLPPDQHFRQDESVSDRSFIGGKLGFQLRGIETAHFLDKFLA